MGQWRNAKRVSIYLSTRYEAQTSLLLQDAFVQGKTVFVPKISRGAMDMVLVESKDIQDMPLNAYGIREPVSDKTLNGFDGSVDLVITPGVAFDRTKNRLGHGKGYYDTWIAKQSPRPTLIGVGLQEQLVDKVPRTESDQQLDILVINGAVL